MLCRLLWIWKIFLWNTIRFGILLVVFFSRRHRGDARIQVDPTWSINSSMALIVATYIRTRAQRKKRRIWNKNIHFMCNSIPMLAWYLISKTLAHFNLSFVYLDFLCRWFWSDFKIIYVCTVCVGCGRLVNNLHIKRIQDEEKKYATHT